jgi:hypothetical protein
MCNPVLVETGLAFVTTGVEQGLHFAVTNARTVADVLEALFTSSDVDHRETVVARR